MINSENSQLQQKMHYLEHILTERTSNVVILVIYAVSLSLFLLSYVFSDYILFLIPRLLFGLICFLLVPGLTITQAVLPSHHNGIAHWIIISILTSFFAIQISFFFSIFLEIHLELYVWLSIIDTIIVSMGIAYLKYKNRSFTIRISAILDYSPMFRTALVLGFLIRIGLQILAIGSLAPDASLYSDYARGIVEGTFTSGVDNDSAVYNLSDGIQYVAHQCVTFLFSLSWIIVPPTSSGPTFLLVIIGSILLYPSYSIVERYLGSNTAAWVAFILALSPVLVFHSAIAYGPEILSLAFILFALNFLLEKEEQSWQALLLSGILLGFTDGIWYVNFYIVCMILPVILHFGRNQNLPESIGITVLIALTMLSRLIFTNTLFYILTWIAIILLLLAFKVFRNTLNIHRLTPMFLGIGFIIAIFRSPFLMASSSVSGVQGTVPETTTLWSVLLAPIEFGLFVRFFLFILFHLSIVLFFLIFLGVLKKEHLKITFSFVLAALIASIGTLKIFGHFTKDTLLSQYLYSDSRYFLLIVVLLIFATGAYLKDVANSQNTTSIPATLVFGRWSKTSVIIVVVLIGFIPGYLTIPSGTTLIDYEDRYGWNHLNEGLEDIGTANTIFLVERAREFVWYTNRLAAVLLYNQPSPTLLNISQRIIALAAEQSTPYILIDDYLHTRFGILECYYLDNIELRKPMLLNVSRLLDPYSDFLSNEISLQLVFETEPNDLGRYSRVYEFTQSDYTRVQSLSFLDSGWVASNDGSIVNTTQGPVFSIGPEANYTNTWRESAFDLDIPINHGLMLMNISEISATVARIELWDSEGNLLRYAEKLMNGQFYAIIGEETIGDIRIVIEGGPEDSVILNDISVWTVSP